MQTDLILACVTVAMAVLGGLVSAHAPAKTAHKIAYVFVFVLLGLLAIGLTLRLSREQAATTAEMASALRALNSATQENKRLEILNSEQGQQIIALSAKTSLLARQAVNTVTGGNSRPRLIVALNKNPSPEANPPLVLFLVDVVGKNPLWNVHYYMEKMKCTDVDHYSVFWADDHRTPDDTNHQQHDFNILTRGTMVADFRLANFTGFVLSDDLQIFSGSASALNGQWHFLVKVRHERSGWEWRSMIFQAGSDRVVHTVADEHSNGFPPDQLLRPVGSVSADECGKLR